jgi:multiple sugar transport system permease protein
MHYSSMSFVAPYQDHGVSTHGRRFEPSAIVSRRSAPISAQIEYVELAICMKAKLSLCFSGFLDRIKPLGNCILYIPFWSYIFNTVLISGLTIIGTVISCSLIAYGFARIQWPGRNAVFLAYLSTIMLPGQVTMIPLYIFWRRVNLGLQDIEIVYRYVYWYPLAAFLVAILPLVVPAFFGNALYVFLLRQFFLTIPNELSDAARIDGASELGIFARIMVPLLKPALATVALFTFVNSYRDYLGPLIYLQDQSQWTISLGLKMFQNMYGAQWQLMMAAATLTMIPTVILFFLTQRTFIEGITLTGIKG